MGINDEQASATRRFAMATSADELSRDWTNQYAQPATQKHMMVHQRAAGDRGPFHKTSTPNNTANTHVMRPVKA